MFILNWLKDKVSATLYSLGLFNKNAKIVFLGIDDAGKSTLLNRLKNDTMKQIDPTQKPYSEELVLGKIRFRAWDLGGHEAARKTWKNYLCDISGIIYMIDSSNPKRFQESRNQLENLLQIPELQKIPIVILGNKVDKSGAVSESQLRQRFGLESSGVKNWKEGKDRPIQLFMCSIAKKTGYKQGFLWLSNFLQ